jgi:hypothetical protein
LRLCWLAGLRSCRYTWRNCSTWNSKTQPSLKSMNGLSVLFLLVRVQTDRSAIYGGGGAKPPLGVSAALPSQKEGGYRSRESVPPSFTLQGKGA